MNYVTRDCYSKTWNKKTDKLTCIYTPEISTKIQLLQHVLVIQKDSLFNAIRAMQSYASDALLAAAQDPIMDTGATSDTTSDASNKPYEILEDLSSQFLKKVR